MRFKGIVGVISCDTSFIYSERSDSQGYFLNKKLDIHVLVIEN